MFVFYNYLLLGIQHIGDLYAYDHILFIIVLVCVFSLAQWKQILILVTAFTLGHSLTLALAALKIVVFSSELIEFLIPVTIAITAASNLLYLKKTPRYHGVNYGYALFFGLIHGLGFSNYLIALLGKESNVWKPLLAFNIGLEIGQLLIVFCFMVVTYVFVRVLKVPRHWWVVSISLIVLLIALTLIYKNRFWI